MSMFKKFKMKKYLPILVVMLVINNSSHAQAHDLITTMRIGIFKLKSTKADIEKILNKKISFKYNPDDYMDTVKVNYQNADYVLTFTHQYNENNKVPSVYELYAVSSSNTALKTKSGMGIKNTKGAVLSTYDKNDITISNDWNYKEKKNAKDKIQFIYLNDFDASTTLIFTTDNRIVTTVEVRIYEGE
jgi:hypothetical protein